jgi:hypothetical protein
MCTQKTRPSARLCRATPLAKQENAARQEVYLKKIARSWEFCIFMKAEHGVAKKNWPTTFHCNRESGEEQALASKG